MIPIYDLDHLRSRSQSAIDAILLLAPQYQQAYRDVGRPDLGDSAEAQLQVHAAGLSEDTTRWLQQLTDLYGGTMEPRNIPSFEVPQSREQNAATNPYSKGNPCRWYSSVNGVFGEGVPLGVGPGDMFEASFHMPTNTKAVIQVNCNGIGGQDGPQPQIRHYVLYDSGGNTVYEGDPSSLALKLGMNGNPNCSKPLRNLKPGEEYTLVITNTASVPKQNFYLSASYSD